MFDRLSIELVDEILLLLDDDDILRARLACRDLWATVHASFGRRWLSTLYTNLTPTSLDRLANISQTSSMAPHVRCLRIAEYPYTENPRKPLYLTRGVPVEARTWEQQQYPRLCYHGISRVDLDSPQARRFSNMLRQFTNCKELRFTDELEDRLWSGEAADDKLNPIDLLLIILSALDGDDGQMRSLQVQSFELEFGRAPIEKTNSWPSSTELVDMLKRSSWPTHLQQLRINWAFRTSLVPIVVPLVTTATQVTSLTLCQGPYSEPDPFFRELANSPQLPALSELKFAACNGVCPTAICQFIARFQSTLKTLQLQHVYVHRGGSLGAVLCELAGTVEFTKLQCFTVANCLRTYFCPLVYNKEAMDKHGPRLSFAIRETRSKTGINGVRYCVHQDDPESSVNVRLAMAAIGESCYTFGGISGYLEPDLPDVALSEVIPAERVVKKFT
ncbi:hypothetical protein CC79DRAFT_1374268 [Sarocladium strictum]